MAFSWSTDFVCFPNTLRQLCGRKLDFLQNQHFCCHGKSSRTQNKWFMAKNPQKVFGKDSKYKLKVCMQEVSAGQEYRDVDLDDGRNKRADISRLLRDDEVKDVVGKLKRV